VTWSWSSGVIAAHSGEPTAAFAGKRAASGWAGSSAGSRSGSKIASYSSRCFSQITWASRERVELKPSGNSMSIIDSDQIESSSPSFSIHGK
jgi:hypothetical protein